MAAPTLVTVAQANAVGAFFLDATFAPGGFSLRDTAANLAAAAADITIQAIDIISTTAATVAQATVIDGFGNSGSNSYALQDTAANLAATTASVGHGATRIFATTAATVAQAAAIDAFTNSGTNVFSLSDTAAALAAAPTAVANQALRITATTAATVAQAMAIDVFTNSSTNIFSLSDTAAALAAAPAAVANQATKITATTAATVAQAAAIQAFNNTGANSYALSDTAAHLVAAPAVCNGATNITATGVATVAQAAAIDGFANSGSNSYHLRDTAAHLAGAAAPLVAGAIDVNVSDPATVAQAGPLVALNSHTFYGLLDSAAHLLAGPALATVTVQRAQSITVNGPAVSFANADALMALNSHTTGYNLSDTAVHLLLPLGVTVVERDAILSAANTVTVTGITLAADATTLLGVVGAATYSLTDSGQGLLNAPAATIHGAQSVTVSDSLSAAEATTLRGELGTGVHMTYSLVDFAANLLALLHPLNPLDPLVPLGVAAVGGATAVDVITAVTVADAIDLSGLNPNTTYSISDTPTNLLVDPLTPAGVAVIGATSVDVGPDPMDVAQAEQLVSTLNSNATYLLTDTAAHLAGASAVAMFDAIFVVATDAATVTQADTILSLNPNASYALADTGAASVEGVGLVAQAIDEFNGVSVQFPVSLALSVTVTGPAISVADANHIIDVNFTVAYNLSDTAANLVAPLDATTVTDALSVMVTGPAISLADVATLSGLDPNPTFSASAAGILDKEATATISIIDTAAHVATELNNAGALDAFAAQGTIDVTDALLTVNTAQLLTVNAAQFVNLYTPLNLLLAANDTIALDGATDVSANLGTLDPFGGDLTMTLGGALGGSYIVNMGTSGVGAITMDGSGIQNITAALDLAENFIVGVTSTGGSTINNLQNDADSLHGNRGDRIDVGGGGGGLVTRVGSAAAVDTQGEWAFVAGVLTWWDTTPGAAEHLTLGLVGTATDLAPLTNHSFIVV